jgi:8-oxo-dGTP pyrophosphatase MutT (NUDIX family)
LKISDIERVFRERKGRIIGRHKKSAVIILICQEAGEPHIVFEVRAYSLRHQPGDICLPGGRIEEQETPLEAAVREAKEELNLRDEDIEMLGEMDYFISPYRSIIYSFVANLKESNINPSREEVDHIFKVPFSFFLEHEPLCYKMNIGPTDTEGFPFHMVRGGKEYKFSKGAVNQYFYKYGDYVIWGFTARIIKAFIDILREKQ